MVCAFTLNSPRVFGFLQTESCRRSIPHRDYPFIILAQKNDPGNCFFDKKWTVFLHTITEGLPRIFGVAARFFPFFSKAQLPYSARTVCRSTGAALAPPPPYSSTTAMAYRGSSAGK